MPTTKKGIGMPLKMTNEVSLMDIIAIGGLLLGGAAVFFGYGVDITENRVAIQNVQRDLVRVEKHAQDENNKVMDMLKIQTTEMRAIREESQSGRLRIEDKLDKLIERELGRNHRD